MLLGSRVVIKDHPSRGGLDELESKSQRSRWHSIRAAGSVLPGGKSRGHCFADLKEARQVFARRYRG